jgi:hypothetical protein
MTQTPKNERDPLDSAAAELEAAEAATDEDRARILEELYETLESELERDVGQTGPPRY